MVYIGEGNNVLRHLLSNEPLANCSSFLQVVDSIVSHGSFLNNCFIEHSVIGIRSRINANVHLKVSTKVYSDIKHVGNCYFGKFTMSLAA